MAKAAEVGYPLALGVSVKTTEGELQWRPNVGEIARGNAPGLASWAGMQGVLDGQAKVGESFHSRKDHFLDKQEHGSPETVQVKPNPACSPRDGAGEATVGPNCRKSGGHVRQSMLGKMGR